MKCASYCMLYVLLACNSLYGQDSSNTTFSKKSYLFFNTCKDSLHNSYGMLMKDDPEYNKQRHWIIPAGEILLTNAVIWGFDRYILDRNYARVNATTWKNNFKNGWEWDNDKFGVNFVGHPYSGTLYFNAARSNGFNYFESIPFVVGGSLTWEYFAENTQPSYNDLINTTFSGSFMGEIIYRVTSKLLNDQTKGAQRAGRETATFLLNPLRGFNRILQGKSFRVTDQEMYQKEPLNITINGGVHLINNGSNFGTGTSNPMLNFQLDYGDPFELRKRKPFDVFRFRFDITNGTGIKIPTTILGYGLLAGKNYKSNRNTHLLGFFQNYDVWNNTRFELASIGLGAGIISKIPIARESDLYSSFQLSAVPLSGVNTQKGEDTSSYRNFNYGGGVQGKLETTLNLSRWLSISLNGYYYWIHTYNGYPSVDFAKNNVAGIFKPKIAIWFTRSISVGLEQYWYYTSDTKNINTSQTWTEQKFLLQLFIENPRRRGSRYL